MKACLAHGDRRHISMARNDPPDRRQDQGDNELTSETRQPARRRFLTYAATLPAALGLPFGSARAEEPQMPTARDMEGPFYISNVPVVTNLNRFGKRGEAMQIAGRVMNAAAPGEPIPGARLEIWQTDGTGRYHPEANGDYSGFRDSDIDMRGTVIADADGRFSVMSLFPKEYWPRPPHIHYWIRAEGFQPLVTQHYLDTRPRDRPHRTEQVIRTQTPALYPAPTIYLQPA
jgi:protocatechuate 3,4-dioxygenase beta subunit